MPVNLRQASRRPFRQSTAATITEMADGHGPIEFPHGIGKVVRRELALNGYTRYEQLTGVSAADLLRIHGIEPKAIGILREEPAGRGMSFVDERTE
jgi:predicted flap endonuclease-1-like 5' DNA nuclease